jgi:hypothetical protein
LGAGLNLGLVVALVCYAGVASQYGPGIMTNVVEYRREWHQLPPLPAVGYIAVDDCSRIGERVWVKHGDDVEPMVVADCAGDDATRRWMRDNNILMEVDYETALRWDAVGRGEPVVMCKEVKNE